MNGGKIQPIRIVRPSPPSCAALMIGCIYVSHLMLLENELWHCLLSGLRHYSTEIRTCVFLPTYRPWRWARDRPPSINAARSLLVTARCEIPVEPREGKSDECDPIRCDSSSYSRTVTICRGELSAFLGTSASSGRRRQFNSEFPNSRTYSFVGDPVTAVACPPDIFAPLLFSQTGLVLGVYEIESENDIMLTPTATKYNELVNGKLLKNIIL